MNVIVTGSCGLIGYEACNFFLDKGAVVCGIDNNMRSYFFGEQGSTKSNQRSLEYNKNYIHFNVDIRDYDSIIKNLGSVKNIDLIIHAAAQPSHDWAKKDPFLDFQVNAVGTMNMLEFCRRKHPNAVFIFMSTNKVYGDNPNKIPRILELEKEYCFEESDCHADREVEFFNGFSKYGINENMSIDNCTHSLFGVSKASADLMVQEYGRYFGLKTGVFRGGCLTGKQHASVELHGYLHYIVNCAVNKKPYTIFGYKGKQVRDQIHSKDVVSAFYEFYKNPIPGEVFNLGGGINNKLSILTTIDLLSARGYNLDYTIVDENRVGDHICYYTDNRKFENQYKNWKINYNLDYIIDEIIKECENKKKK